MSSNHKAVQIIANWILNYIKPACERLKIENPNDFLEPKILSGLVKCHIEQGYTTQNFKKFITEKEEDWGKHSIEIEKFGDVLELVQASKIKGDEFIKLMENNEVNLQKD